MLDELLAFVGFLVADLKALIILTFAGNSAYLCSLEAWGYEIDSYVYIH